MSNQNELIGLLWAWLSMAVGGGILFGGVWLLCVQPPRRLFGPQRFRAVPWRGVDVLAVIFFTVYFIPVVIQTIAKLKEPYVDWLPTLTLPFRVATILFLLSAGMGTRPYQLGLTRHRLPANLVLGYVAWVILTPLVYGVLILMVAIDSWLLPTSPEKHPLIEALETNPGFLGYLMVLLAAVVSAPLFEELLFRGVLQPWVARRSWGADAALVGAFALAVCYGLGSKTDKIFPLAGNPDHWRALMRSLAPGIFVLATIPGYLYADRLFWKWLPHPGAGRTIYAVSLVWAAVHSNVWPSPIPLFFLGLGLGYLAHRTQSLVSCITVHVLFNGMTVLGLLWT